jgi:pimeloyl-ACP methyl ester carboxylesterase
MPLAGPISCISGLWNKGLMKKLTLPICIVIVLLTLSLNSDAQAPTSHWAKYDTGKVRYYDVGKRNKKAIVFIHGWTCNADFWKDSYASFPGYRVIAIDLPGHGQSDKPHANYSMDYFAKSIDAVMKDAKVKQAVLVGHSMGTPVIRQFYRTYPGKTLALVLVDGALKPFGPREQTEKFFTPLFEHYAQQAPIFVDGLLGPTRADLKPWIRTQMMATPDYVSISAMHGMLDDSIWGDDQIKVPVLAVMADKPWPANTGEVYKTVAPDLEFIQWTGVSHFLMMERPKEFNDAITAFVTKKKLL